MFRVNTPSVKKINRLWTSNNFEDYSDDYKFNQVNKNVKSKKNMKYKFRFDSLSKKYSPKNNKMMQRNNSKDIFMSMTPKIKHLKQVLTGPNKKKNFIYNSNIIKSDTLGNSKRFKFGTESSPKFLKMKKNILKSTFNSPFNLKSINNRKSKKLKKFIKLPVIGVCKNISSQNIKKPKINTKKQMKKKIVSNNYSSRNIMKKDQLLNSDLFNSNSSFHNLNVLNRNNEKVKKNQKRTRKYKKLGVSMEPQRRDWVFGI
jgi:hypothetical protein